MNKYKIKKQRRNTKARHAGLICHSFPARQPLIQEGALVDTSTDIFHDRERLTAGNISQLRDLGGAGHIQSTRAGRQRAALDGKI